VLWIIRVTASRWLVIPGDSRGSVGKELVQQGAVPLHRCALHIKGQTPDTTEFFATAGPAGPAVYEHWHHRAGSRRDAGDFATAVRQSAALQLLISVPESS
jgi:hypothetical protein